jgi:hypothetical protein
VFLLLLPPLKFSSKITRGLLQGWSALHGSLLFQIDTGDIAAHLTIAQLYCLSLQSLPFSLEDYNALQMYSNSQGVTTAKHLYEAGQWLPLEAIEGRICSTREVGKQQFTELLAWISQSPRLTTNNLQSNSGWYWVQDGIKCQGWKLRTSQWRSLLPRARPNFKQLNARWTLSWDNAQWLKLWHHLWKGWGHPRSRLVLWQINSRGALWGVCLSDCPRCSLQAESISHLFFLCP